MIISILTYTGLNLLLKDVSFFDTDFLKSRIIENENENLELAENLNKKQEDIREEISEKRSEIQELISENSQIKIDELVEPEKKITVNEKLKLLEEAKKNNNEQIKELRNNINDLQRESRDIFEDKKDIWKNELYKNKFIDNKPKKINVSLAGIPVFIFSQIIYGEIQDYRLLPAKYDKFSRYLFSLTFQGFFNLIFFGSLKIILFDSFLVIGSIYTENLIVNKLSFF